VVVFGAGSEVAEAGVHNLEVLLELLDLSADAAEQHVLLGEDGAELAQEDLQDALGGAHHGSLHGCLGKSSGRGVLGSSFGCALYIG